LALPENVIFQARVARLHLRREYFSSASTPISPRYLPRRRGGSPT